MSRAIGDWEYKNDKLNRFTQNPQVTRPKGKKGKGKEEEKLNTERPYRKMEESQKYKISAFPDIKKVEIDKENHDFIVIACDGIWDCYTNEQVAQQVRESRQKGPIMLTLKRLKKLKQVINSMDGYPAH